MSRSRSTVPPPRLDEHAAATFAFGDFEFDEERWELRQNGVAVGVPPKVMQTIGILVRNRDRVVSNEELFASLWPDVIVTEASLAKSIRIARQVLGDDGNTQQYIKTTRGRGYRFVASVRELGARRSTRPPPPLLEDLDETDATHLDPPFIGREAELADLRGGLNRAYGGHGSFFLVSGDVGSGKTRLIEAFAEAAGARGARTVWGRCCEEGGAPELWPWRQIVRTLARPGTEPLDSGLSHGVTDLGDSADASVNNTSVQTDAARFRFFDSIATAIRQAADESPLVLVLEDLQSSDGASLALTRFLARELASSAVVLIGTYRQSDVESAPELAASIGKLVREALSITLRGLVQEETGRFLEAMLQEPPETTLVSKVHLASEGNPLFVAEIARQMRTAPTSSQRLEVGLPGRVVEVIRGRLETLPPRSRDLLSVASVIGRDFELPVLERVTERPREEVIAGLQSAIDRRIVSPTGSALESYRFSHTLFRDVLYDAMGVSQRAELHFRTGEALEALSPGSDVPAAQLAHHFRIAAGGSASSKAARYAMEAGNQALRSFAFTEAARYFDGALEALRLGAGQEPLIIETLTSLGHAHRLAGNYAGAGTAFTRALSIARQRDDSKGLARAALGFAQVHPETGNVNLEAMRLLEQVVPLLEAAPSTERDSQILLSMVLSRLSMCSAFAGRAAEAEEQSRQGLELARRLGEPYPLARALEARHWVLWRPGTANERLALGRELLELATNSLDASLMTEARVCEITDLLELGRRDAFDRAISQYERAARESRDSNALYNVRVFDTTRAILEGRFADAERIAEEALPIGARIFLDNARNFYSAAILWIRLEQGRAHEIVDVYRAYFESEPPSALLRSTILRLCAEMDDHAAARAELDAICPDGTIELRDDWAFFATAAHLAVACWLLGDAERARALRDRLLPHAGSHAMLGPAVVYLGPVSFYLGLCQHALGQLEEAVNSFGRAIAECEQVGARAIATRVRYHLADALARSGPESRERALSLAREVTATATELGTMAVARRADDLGRRLSI